MSGEQRQISPDKGLTAGRREGMPLFQPNPIDDSRTFAEDPRGSFDELIGKRWRAFRWRVYRKNHLPGSSIPQPYRFAKCMRLAGMNNTQIQIKFNCHHLRIFKDVRIRIPMLIRVGSGCGLASQKKNQNPTHSAAFIYPHDLSATALQIVLVTIYLSIVIALYLAHPPTKRNHMKNKKRKQR